MRLFHWSNMYLSLLFVAVALDPLLITRAEDVPVRPAYEVGEARRQDDPDQQHPEAGLGASSATAQTSATATRAGTAVLGMPSARLCRPETVTR